MASTTASSPPPASLSHDIEDIITPSRKVRALLAQFDDSDSDQSILAENDVPAAEINVSKAKPPENGAEASSDNLRVSDSTRAEPDDEVLQQRPRGRLASRMEAAVNQEHSETSEDDSGANAYARIKDQIAELSKSKTAFPEIINSGSSEDELQHQVSRRKLLKRKSTTPEDGLSREGTRSPSPLFFPSPSAPRSSRKSPSRHSSPPRSDSDELPDDPLKQKGSKFLALVEKHRKQRLAREAADEAKRAERLEQLKNGGPTVSANLGGAMFNGLSDESDVSDGDVGKKLTQQARPTRKASKKAIEEMNRETQRMSRSMQLAHQAKTKKKISKESLLARFNFTIPGSGTGQSPVTDHASVTASSAPASEVEASGEHKTRPTRPPPPDEGSKLVMEGQIPADTVDTSVVVENDELPAVEAILTSQHTTSGKGKGKASDVDGTAEIAKQPFIMSTESKASRIRVRWSKQDAVIARGADSDSDLEIVTSKSRSKKIAAFENLSHSKSLETNSHLILRSLAHLQTGTANGKHFSMNAAQMEAHLRRAARMQANKEREEKLEELKSRGVFIQTVEEREKEQQEVEDLVEQARVEGAEIQRREKAIAKKDGTFIKDHFDDADSDDEDDADFQDVDEEAEDHMSGSEEEEQENEADDEDGVESQGESIEEHAFNLEKGSLIDQEADESQLEDESQGVPTEDENGETSEKENQSPRCALRNRRSLVISDDDDEENDVRHPSPLQNAKTPQSVLRSARKVIPGLQISDDLPIGLTQAFAATMADSGSAVEGINTQEQDSVALTRDLPSLQFNTIPSLDRLESLDIVTDSLPATQTQPLNLDLSSASSQGVPESPAGMSSTQFSFMPTQDVGYIMSPFKENRFDTPMKAPHSTIDTVILPQEEQSPILQRKGRLRRGRAVGDSDDEVVEPESEATGLGLDKSAFAAMQSAAKRANQQEEFDKAKSHAKEVVDEAAEESEDEYAGLGGASDDEDGEEDEADRKMIDHDERLGQGDEGKLAGFYADEERKQDEAAVSKLLKDITTGALRRKRGAADDLDLSDEEDANARRREAKRREFALMRRELLKDEAVGKIAEDKKKQAFLKSIEDREEAEDEDEAFHEEEENEDSQSQPQHADEITSQAEISTTDNRLQRKRPLEPSAADITNHPPPTLRRIGISNKTSSVHRKPSNLAEIREHLSFLIEETDSQNKTPDILSSDDEAQEPEAYVNLDRHLHQADDENEDGDEGLADFIVDDERPTFKKPELPTTRAPANERRTKPNVIDRLSLLRQSSSSSSLKPSTSRAGGSKLAFFSSKSSDNPSTFKVPSLLRRATTASSLTSESGTSRTSATGVTVTERGAVEHEKEMIRKAQGGKRSAINYYAKGRVEEREKERVRLGRVGKNRKTTAKKGKGGFLGGLFGAGGSWE